MTSKAIPKSWSRSYRLGDGCSIKHGFAFKGSLMTTDDNQDLPIVVNIVNFQYTGGFRFDSTKIQRYVGTFPDEYVLRSNDVLIVMTCQTPKGEILGIPGRIPRDGRIYLHNQRMGLVSIKDTDALDLRFLYYLFISPHFNAHLFATATGAKILHTSPSRIENYRFSRPPLASQRKIAAILSAYDDLIENNTRRIKILEEMAQLLYREWFVHFRFPGHEGVKMVKGVPEGWEVKPIGEVVETMGGSTPSTKTPEYWDNGEIVWFTPSDLTTSKAMFIADSSKKITNQGLKNSSARIFPAYSVMMTSRATIGVIAINTKPACTNQGFITCIPNELVSVYQLFFWIVENKEKIENVASGATYKEINRTEFREFPFFVADPQTNSLFVEVLTPMGKQIENLLAKNANLRRTRDLLLPRLVSGEVEVSQVSTDEHRINGY